MSGRVSDTPKITVALVPRAIPLTPVAACARGAVAEALVAKLLTRDDAALAKLSGVSADGIVIVCGPSDALPWVDGIVYLGYDPAAPSLLFPTTLVPDVHPALFERAVIGLRRVAGPVAVLADPHALISLGTARPLDRKKLAALHGSRGGGAS
jgi:hypothetical protein